VGASPPATAPAGSNRSGMEATKYRAGDHGGGAFDAGPKLRIAFAQILVCWSSPTTKCVRRWGRKDVPL
jgi:hypothetical protein